MQREGQQTAPGAVFGLRPVGVEATYGRNSETAKPKSPISNFVCNVIIYWERAFVGSKLLMPQKEKRINHPAQDFQSSFYNQGTPNIQ